MPTYKATSPGWRWDDDWRRVMLMDWLCTPPLDRNPTSRAALAAQMNIDPRTMRGWISEPQFQAAWKERAEDIIGDPSRAQAVLDTLFKAATHKTKPSVQAAKLYLEATHAIKPQPVEVTVRHPTDLSDDELDALIASEAREIRASRDEPSAD